ncbi:dockerin type I domain-containing protein [Eubacteriales bacterium OttesenSCG-928-M02]|nr:dockerin type I domain-containing protein [Eubacteriales bacterium OttesenSCG-928-M02]
MKGYQRATGIALSIILLGISLLALFPVPVAQAASRVGYVTTQQDPLTVRSAPSASAGIINNVPKWANLEILGESGSYYQIPMPGGGYGYVAKSYITIGKRMDDPGATDAAFEQHMKDQNFPESYKPYLRILKKKYPNATFLAQHINLDWSKVVEEESVPRRNLVFATKYKEMQYRDENGNIVYGEGTAFVLVNKEGVAFSLDPRNFLTDPQIFMFEKLSYDEANHTIAGVQAILNGTFMAGNSKYVDESKKTWTYAEMIMEAARVSKVSPYLLAARLRQEQGTNGNSLSDNGDRQYTKDGVQYYNFFNYSASGSTAEEIFQNGGAFAAGSPQSGGIQDGRPWNTQLKSIVGGAIRLGEGYITPGQDTLYYQKFNVVNEKGGLFWHQYMQNITAPDAEAIKTKTAYQNAGQLNNHRIFSIPVYQNMPAEHAPYPSVSTTSTPGSGTAHIVGNGAVVQGNNICGVGEGTSASTLLGKITANNCASVRIVSAGGSVTSGTVGTGCRVQLLNSSGGVVKEYTVLVYGDTNGTGKVDISDLLRIQKNILGFTSLSGAYATAADTNRNGKVDIQDLLQVRKQLLGLSKINQN